VEDTPERALDEYLVSLSQAASVEALDGLTRRWTPRLLRYASRVLAGFGDSTDAARDDVQETWVGVIRGLRGLRIPRSARPGSMGLRRANARTRSEPMRVGGGSTRMWHPAKQVDK
jgi:hypothetical protein